MSCFHCYYVLIGLFFSIVKILIISELTKYLQPYFTHSQEFNFLELEMKYE